MDEPKRHQAPIARPRHDGWTEDRQIGFLGALHRTRNVAFAAATVGMSRESAYRLRARPSGAAFGAAWDRILRDKAGHTDRHMGHACPPSPRAISQDEVDQHHDCRGTARHHQHHQLARLSSTLRAELLAYRERIKRG